MLKSMIGKRKAGEMAKAQEKLDALEALLVLRNKG